MSIGHEYMRPVLAMARKFDIADNPDPNAIFEAGSGGFQIWCTPADYPKGWRVVAPHMTMGSFSKPCAYVGSVHWGWNEDVTEITHILFSTAAYELRAYDIKHQNDEASRERLFKQSYYNRDEDINWAREKIKWLFEQAQVKILPVEVETGEQHPKNN